VALMIDGVHFADHVVLTTIGIDREGAKPVFDAAPLSSTSSMRRPSARLPSCKRANWLSSLLKLSRRRLWPCRPI